MMGKAQISEMSTNRARRKKPSPIKVELSNLLSWSGIGNLVFGFLLVLAWAAIEFVEEAQMYIVFAAPLVTPEIMEVLLVLGLICIINSIVSFATIGAVMKGKKSSRILLVIVGLMQVYLPPAGTFFGVILITFAIKFPEDLSSKEQVLTVKDAHQLIGWHAISIACTCLFVILITTGFYIIPVEFAEDSDYYWLRLNFWNIIYAVIGIYAGIIALVVISSFLAIKNVKGWKILLGISCFLMLFAIPVGPYLAGVFYRSLLKRK
ncbi:MAG: hypothetical protein ACFFCS_06800 [Candidatus Hodarchaeota archaeon]